MSASTTRVLVASIVSVLACSAVSAAGKTVPGERWQHKMTMQMEGMSMSMPASEVCAPVGQAAQELAKPDKNCTLSNVKQSGNRFSADVKCTGKDAMSGSMDMTTGADRMTGKMIVRTADGEMTMVTESRKLGACQAVDAGAMVAQVEAQAAQGQKMAAQAQAQVCASDSYKLKSDPGKVGGAAMMFLGQGAQCAGKTLPADFCSAVQSRGGFTALQQTEAAQKGILGRSIEACKLGTGKAAVDSLLARLVTSAEAAGDGDFIVANAPARARQLAKSECVLKGEMWGGRKAQWDSFCDSNFAEAARRAVNP